MRIIFRISLIIVIFHLTNVRCWKRKSLMWDKNSEEFVDLYSIPVYAAFLDELLDKDTNLEIEDLMGKVIKDRNMVTFHDNDTRISGVCGEIWNLLADDLNFTLVPVKSRDHIFGERLENGSFTGLLRMLYAGETDVILRSGLYVFRRGLLHYTVPVWKSGYHLYIRPRYTYDNDWIFTIFAQHTWYSIIGSFFILSVAGYYFQKGFTDVSKTKGTPDCFTFSDYVFYNFSMLCQQGFVPYHFYDKFKILSFSTSMFAWLLLLGFNSNLIYKMANRTPTLPFADIGTLLNSTNYKIVAYNGSMVYESFKKLYSQLSTENHITENRLFNVTSPSKMYNIVCYNDQLDAMFEVSDAFLANQKSVCGMVPAGRSYYETWIGFAVLKTFEHKKAIDTSLIKLHEVGLVDAQRQRWLNSKIQIKQNNEFQRVDVKQVFVILTLFCYGIPLSLIVLAMEKIAFLYEGNHK